MHIDFELKEKQKILIRKKYEAARGKADKKGAPIGPLRFIDSYLCIKHDLLEEAFRCGYMAIRVKRDGNSYKCFFFEILAPLTRIWLSETDRQINWMHDVQTRPVRDAMEKVISNYLANGGKLGGQYKNAHYIRRATKTAEYGIFMNQVQQFDAHSCEDNAFLHTHPYIREGILKGNEFVSLSSEDMLTICRSEHSSYAPYFLCALSIDVGRFMEEAKAMAGDCFDDKGFLKPEHVKGISCRLAAENMTKRGLKALYDKGGVFLVAGQKSRDKPNTLEIFQKLRIT